MQLALSPFTSDPCPVSVPTTRSPVSPLGFDDMLGILQTRPSYRVSPDTLLLTQAESASLELMMKINTSCSAFEVVDHLFMKSGWPHHTAKHVLSNVANELQSDAPPMYSPVWQYTHNVIAILPDDKSGHTRKSPPPPYHDLIKTPELAHDFMSLDITNRSLTHQRHRQQVAVSSSFDVCAASNESDVESSRTLSDEEGEGRYQRQRRQTDEECGHVSTSSRHTRASTTLEPTTPITKCCIPSGRNHQGGNAAVVEAHSRHRQSSRDPRGFRGEKKFRCAECGSGFTIARVLFRHMATVHGGVAGEVVRRFRCNGCGERSNRKDSLQRHQRNKISCKGTNISDDGPVCALF